MVGPKERHAGSTHEHGSRTVGATRSLYRHVERALDLSFVRPLVQTTFTHGGRPSIDRARMFQTATRAVFQSDSFRALPHTKSAC